MNWTWRKDWQRLQHGLRVEMRDRIQRVHGRIYREGEERARLCKRLVQAETKIRRLQSKIGAPNYKRRPAVTTGISENGIG